MKEKEKEILFFKERYSKNIHNNELRKLTKESIDCCIKDVIYMQERIEYYQNIRKEIVPLIAK